MLIPSFLPVVGGFSSRLLSKREVRPAEFCLGSLARWMQSVWGHELKALLTGSLADLPAVTPVLKHAGHIGISSVAFHVQARTLFQQSRRERNDRAMRLGQDLIHHAVSSDGGKSRCTLRAKHNQVGQLGSALKEQFLRRIAQHDHGLQCDPSLQLRWNQRHQVSLNFIDRSACQGFMPLLRPDHMLQNQPCAVLSGQLGSKFHNRATRLLHADRAEDCACGKPAVVSGIGFRTDDVNGDFGATQHGLGYRANQQLADETGE